MNKDFYERCKSVVTKLDLTYEQGIARDVILNELDMLEKQAEDYQKRFSKAIEYIETTNFWGLYDDTPMEEVKYGEELLEILKEVK